MEDYRLDSHKLIFHPDRVAKWLKGAVTYPINAEIGLAGACNHRCTFCSIDYMGYKAAVLPKSLTNIRFREMREKGLKSILFAGTGEPLLNKEAPDIINDTKLAGIDVALSTNGVLLKKEISEECLEAISWIRFSVSAGTERTYKAIHRGKDGDLERVFTNIYDAVELKRKRNLKTVLGIQIVMIPENEDEVLLLAEKAKELGVDWYSVKSFGHFQLSKNPLKEEFERNAYYKKHEDISKKLAELNDDSFKAIYRKNRISKMSSNRTYSECHAMPFHVLIDATGNVWPCCALIGMKDMCFGNIYEQSFEKIWLGKQRERAIEYLTEMKLSICIPDCRLDDMNRYLQELKYPGDHVNFI